MSGGSNSPVSLYVFLDSTYIHGPPMLAHCYLEGEPSLCTELLERGLARPYLP